jgi:hypothetical protein
MNISHVWAARYQHVEERDTCRPVCTLVRFDAGILRFVFQQLKYEYICICMHTGNHPSMFCLANQDIRRAVIPLLLGTMSYYPLEIFTKLVNSVADF